MQQEATGLLLLLRGLQSFVAVAEVAAVLEYPQFLLTLGRVDQVAVEQAAYQGLALLLET